MVCKKEKYFPLIDVSERGENARTPKPARLESLRSMFLVTFLTVNRSGAIGLKRYLTFLPTVRTSNGVHLPRAPIKTRPPSVSVKTLASHYGIPPWYNRAPVYKRGDGTISKSAISSPFFRQLLASPAERSGRICFSDENCVCRSP
jgi:hypothetical protein